ncbi:MAG: hypothetical protein EOP32_38475 [Rhodococcus sp. (in: high G+C Gram-positive bacteria)]|nr:MAG: hypothetical protein EOP32_38475 [Rhodococcus sp. (in: high G+C Gram-positive bacteria)]
MSKDDVSKVTANLPNDDIKTLDEIAKRHASTKTSALVRAIRTTAYIDEAASNRGPGHRDRGRGQRRQQRPPGDRAARGHHPPPRRTPGGHP